MQYTQEDFYNEMRQGMVSRFKALPESEQNIMRQNIDSSFSKIAMKVLGFDFLSGLPHMRRPND
mgnify:CR=1 FL=1